MNLAAAYIFGIKQGFSPLQALINSCIFAFNADTSGYVGNNYAPEVGLGNLVRGVVSQSTGIVNQALNVANSSTKTIQGDSNLNSDTNLLLKNSDNSDKSYFISYWIKINALPSNQTAYSIWENRDTLGTSIVHYMTDSKIVLLEQGDGSLDTRFTLPSSIINTWTHFAVFYDASLKTHKLLLNTVNQTPFSQTNSNFIKKNILVNSIKIGKNIINNSPLNGAIDIFSIHKDLEFNQGDVNLLYNNGNGIQIF
jgi:hypothetical protein